MSENESLLIVLIQAKNIVKRFFIRFRLKY